MLELERTFLAKYLPSDLKQHAVKEIIDIYIPAVSLHPTLRIRKSGEKYEITKKEPKGKDSSVFTEETIKLTEEEFKTLSATHGKRVAKDRYLYPCNGRIAEIDVFKDALKGLVLVDFEFETEEQMRQFIMPDFCLYEVTQETATAGGKLCGKSYSDIEPFLKKCQYVKI